MTETLNKQELDISKTLAQDPYPNSFENKIKRLVLCYVFQNFSFTIHKERIRALTVSEYTQISEELNIPITFVHTTVSKFLINLIRFRLFMKENGMIYGLKSKYRKVRVFLHKIYRLAPVFDYRRARYNAKVLQVKLDHLCFWPHISTQVALVVFITDLYDTELDTPLMQSNIRALCCCSAYAFHRSRNKIGFPSPKRRNK